MDQVTDVLDWSDFATLLRAPQTIGVMPCEYSLEPLIDSTDEIMLEDGQKDRWLPEAYVPFPQPGQFALQMGLSVVRNL